jgi:hypothetical protein
VNCVVGVESAGIHDVNVFTLSFCGFENRKITVLFHFLTFVFFLTCKDGLNNVVVKLSGSLLDSVEM